MDVARYIDHTVLKPTATRADIEKLCSEAKDAGFAAVCLPPYWIADVRNLLQGSDVKIATVIGFPFGYNSISSKLKDVEDAITASVDELDIVINLLAVKNSDWDYIAHEINSCVELIHSRGKLVKIIVESGVLSDEELINCCKLVNAGGADFIKTSTGYADHGASTHAVQLMRQQLPEGISIKASGGIRTFAFAKELIDAGASRIGCSASLTILEESKQEQY
jgi:deoxyribose-phosphate aldolase